MGTAFHSYILEFGHLPPADGSRTKEQPALTGTSWRAHILRFLELGGVADEQRDLMVDFLEGKNPPAAGKEPWDRPELVKLTLPLYAPRIPQKNREPWLTNYRVFVGPGTAFEPNKVIKITDFPDGTENTILIVEAAEAVPWPKPAELVYDPGKPLPKLGGQFADGFYACFADASVRFIPRDMDEKQLRALITRNGGEKVDALPPVDTEALRKAAGFEDLPLGKGTPAQKPAR
jgi:hypothetical protein